MLVDSVAALAGLPNSSIRSPRYLTSLARARGSPLDGRIDELRNATGAPC